MWTRGYHNYFYDFANNKKLFTCLLEYSRR